MDSYAASWRQTLFKLRFPAAVPFMIPALKLGGDRIRDRRGGRGDLDRPGGRRGRLIIEYAREATSDPAKVFTAVFARGRARAGDGRPGGADRPGDDAEPPEGGLMSDPRTRDQSTAPSRSGG